jgi:hypothetical protein
VIEFVDVAIRVVADDEVRTRVHERMRRVNEVVERMVRGFVGGE